MTAIAPILVCLALGAVLRRRLITDPGFWQGLGWLSYNVCGPALFISSIAGSDLTDIAARPFMISLIVPVLTASALLIVLRRPLRSDGPQLTSIVQGSIRINTYIGLGFASALNGSAGVTWFALAAAVMVPLVNVVSVATLSRYGHRQDAHARPPSVWRELLVNPLILGCVGGITLNLSGIRLPGPIAAPIEMLAAPALVAGTLVAGAAITFRLRMRDGRDIVVASLLKLVALPLAAAGIASAVHVTGAALTAIVLICAVPTAPSATILAARLGGDTRLMASITGAQTVLSVTTLPVILHVSTIL